MDFNRAILRSFCTGNDRRPITCAPWSVGEYSYATDGHIIVRVARAADVPDAERGIEKTAALIDKWLVDLANVNRVQLPKIDIPKGRVWTCDKCEGRGFEHDCPACECECSECEHGQCYQQVAVAWHAFHISAKLWKLINALPNSKIAQAIAPSGHISFVFDGGAGIVMPMRPNLEDDPLIVSANVTEPAE